MCIRDSFITVTLVIESILAKIQQKESDNFQFAAHTAAHRAGNLTKVSCFFSAHNEVVKRHPIRQSQKGVTRNALSEQRHFYCACLLYTSAKVIPFPTRSVSLKPTQSRTAFPICAGTRTMASLVRTSKDRAFNPCLRTLKPGKWLPLS